MSTSTARFNLSLPNRGVLLGFLSAEDLLDAASRADASGLFGGISVGDNLLEKPRLEAIALLGALTARTRHARLNVGCLSTFVLRDPILFAIQWASLDVLSGGRMELSVCIGGGDDREMLPYRMDRRERVPRLLETLAVVRRLWAEDHVSVAGRFHRFEDVTALPKPVQKRPPVYLASLPEADAPAEVVDRMLRRALDHADGWHPTGLTPSRFAELRERLETLAAESGRDLSDFSVGCGSLVNIQSDSLSARAEAEEYVRRYWPRTYGPPSFERLISGGPREVADGLLRYWDAGCRNLSVRIGAVRYEGQLPRLIDDVMPLVWQGVRDRGGPASDRPARA